jgi:hypothetical protein
VTSASYPSQRRPVEVPGVKQQLSLYLYRGKIGLSEEKLTPKTRWTAFIAFHTSDCAREKQESAHACNTKLKVGEVLLSYILD